MTDMNGVKESSEDKRELVNDGSITEVVEVHEPLLVKEVDSNVEKLEEGREEVGGKVEVEEEMEKSENGVENEHDKEMEPRSNDIADDGGRELHVEVSPVKNANEDMDPPAAVVEESNAVDTRNAVSNAHDGGMSVELVVAKTCDNGGADVSATEASLTGNVGMTEKSQEQDEKETLIPETEDVGDAKLDFHHSLDNNKRSPALKVDLMKDEELKDEAITKEGTMEVKSKIPDHSCIFDTDTSGGGESGTEDEQAAFMNELEKFCKLNFLDFKPPKFYGEPLNLLKLWRSVMRLGGYDKVTACKYWRQVGESFKPPKTCTTVSWTFRIFYEKALLEYERYRTSGDGVAIHASLAGPLSSENQASGSGRARRDAAARAMQGWHSQRILDNGEVSDPIIKDKNSSSLSKKEKQLKTLGPLKRKKTSSTDAAVKDVRVKVPRTQSETTVIDIGSPADWVKINVRVTKDCYEVYALVPGLLREEVRVQSDPAGRLVISGEPENLDNPWSVTPFKKVVNLPSRIDPHQTSAVVTLHGQLFVRVPFEHEQYD